MQSTPEILNTENIRINYLRKCVRLDKYMSGAGSVFR